jgi:hypothetical protein
MVVLGLSSVAGILREHRAWQMGVRALRFNIWSRQRNLLQSMNLPERDAAPNTLSAVRNTGSEKVQKSKLLLLRVTEAGLTQNLSSRIGPKSLADGINRLI